MGRERIYETVKIDQHSFFKKYKEATIDSPYHVLLESGRGGRYSIAAWNPKTIIQGKGVNLTIQDVKSNQVIHQKGDLLQLIERYMAPSKLDQTTKLPDFQGGLIGYISYDYIRQIERIPQLANDDLCLPELYFIEFEDLFVLDQQTDTLFIITHYENECQSGLVKAKERLATYLEFWEKVEGKRDTRTKLLTNTTLPAQTVSMTETQFIDAVKRIQKYIKEGDVFQVNLSVRQTEPLQSSPIAIYEELRRINPSPYMCYYHTPDFQLVSGSPELLIKKREMELSTRPIAGTRSRGKNEEEDIQLAKTLIENEKERAEHIMLVDLERNDLGKVCQYGTVVVDEFMVIEKYSHVQHIVSNVKGKILPTYNAYDAIRATFPGGTITGAPKIRTMEIIEELEPVKRGIYTGSIGWIGYNGDMELNIAIRTMVIKEGFAHVQAGAGIVIDSKPKAEYKESLKKAKALWRAKELSEQNIQLVEKS